MGTCTFLYRVAQKTTWTFAWRTQHSIWNESAEKHVCNEQTSSNMSMNFHLKRFHISRDTSEIVLHVIKQCLQAFYHHRNRFSRKLMVSAGVSMNGKTEIFSPTLKRLKSTWRLTLTFWRRPCYQNAAVCVQTMISSSVFMQDSAPSHRSKATKNFLRDNTPDFISSQEFARFESARLFSLGYLARTCLQRKAWTICKSQSTSECYQRQMARCQ